MQIKISARHGHLSDETQAKIKEKLEKLPRYYDRLVFDRRHGGPRTPRCAERRSSRFGRTQARLCRRLPFHGIDGRRGRSRGKDGTAVAQYKTKIQDRHRGPGHRQAERPRPAAGARGPGSWTIDFNRPGWVPVQAPARGGSKSFGGQCGERLAYPTMPSSGYSIGIQREIGA